MRRIAPFRLLLGFLSVVLSVAPLAAGAQGWSWTISVASATTRPIVSRSALALESDAVTLDFFTTVGDRDVRVESCRIALDDLESVRTFTNAGHSYFFAQLRGGRTVRCLSGTRPFAAIPIDPDASARAALAAVSRVCCGTTAASHARPAQTLAAVARINARPASSPTPRASMRPDVIDWVENEGIFVFVRMRNRGTQAVAVTAGDVESCRNVVAGCGAFPANMPAIRPGATSTLATLIVGSARDIPAFSYRYTVRTRTAELLGTGWTNKAPSGWGPRLTPVELRAAEAGAVAQFRPAPAPGNTVVPSAVPALADAKVRLQHRGSSRLAIGMTGAVVVRVNVSASGSPEGATIVSASNRRLIPAAIETAISSTYAPAVRAGRPIAAPYVVSFTFDGDDPALSSIPMWKRVPSPAPSDAR